MIFKYVFFQVNILGISKDKHYYFMTEYFILLSFSITGMLIPFLRVKPNFFITHLEAKSDLNLHKVICGLYLT